MQVQKRTIVLVAGVVVTAILLASWAQPPRAFAQTASAAPQTLPAFDHIFIIMEENHSYSQIIGSGSAPFIKSLAHHYGDATNYSSITHPSLPNYIALTGGSTFGISSDCQVVACPVNARNLMDNIEAVGKTWKAYLESMPAPCTTTHSGEYAPRHNPFVYYDDIRTNSARCASHVVPYTALATDLQSAATTPNFVWITPNQCDDMDACSVRKADQWLRSAFTQIYNSPAWTTQNSVIFVIWDEGARNHVPVLVVGPTVIPAFHSAVAYNHYSVLRTIEVAWGLPALTSNDANASVMLDFWR